MGIYKTEFLNLNGIYTTFVVYHNKSRGVHDINVGDSFVMPY